MLAVSNTDIFPLVNGLMQRFPREKRPEIYYGLNTYLLKPEPRGHGIVLDAAQAFLGVDPLPPTPVLADGTIDWNIVERYIQTPKRKLPAYTSKRVNIIDDMLTRAANNDKHALSAMLSNFTPASRPAVKAKVIEFLLDPRANKFELPANMQPKRGRAVEYYEAATKADYSELKREILLQRPSFYEARYWAKVIAKEQAKLEK